MKKQAGFTLIELIMVIVILGILAAFALPRFADLGGDAEQASANGARAAVQSASAIAHSVALARSTVTGDITLEGTTVTLAFSYANAATICAAAGLDATFACATNTATPPVTTVTGPGTCSFTYTQAADANTPPAISAVTGC